MHNFTSNYDKILKVLKRLDSNMGYLHQIRKPKLRDKELIAIDLTPEYMSIDSKYQLFRMLLINLFNKFMIRRNYAKSFEGFKNRILSKITVLTIIQYINMFEFNRNINNLKINIT